MHAADPNISQSAARIRQLDEAAVNRIAAGEVVERPASAVKELVENAIDAGARRIDVTVADGGKTLIRVEDDGSGIPAEDLPLALSRHATSKIDGSDLLNILTFGFRGEALASLGAVGRLSITSRVAGREGARIEVSGGRIGGVTPAASGQGTVVELRDLFYATPARLKFLRSDRAEMQAVTDVVKRLAMAEPYVRVTLSEAGDRPRELFRAEAETGAPVDALRRRLRAVLGREFVENAIPLDAEREGLHLTGFAALPTYSRGAAVQQYLFVNGRPVRDKLLVGALRAAYMDFLSRDRHPAAVLFIDCDPTLVDVNVHPAKTEVRFRDPGTARGLIVSGLRHALADAGHRASTTVAAETLGAFQTPSEAPRVYQMDMASRPRPAPMPAQTGFAAPQAEFSTPSARVDLAEHAPEAEALPLGAARAQVHQNYVISQTEDGIVIVDQHAAHERLVYERLKRQMAENGVRAQALLVPEIVEIGAEVGRLLDVADDLARLGLVIEPFGAGAVAVRETPAVLGQVDCTALLRDILDELTDGEETTALGARIDAILSRVACHGSVRSGRQMRPEEMNALLREMEATPHSGQCNHGRPTYVELKLSDIERLFGRR
ncbi:DNA mismatch repair endonuclease MutL [Alphaproteobacteria bacterium GH1-50]|uniref:DNA mismatch repair protein MutL n=1 Tax=Kangsaoukella pontilimi TaxID=2691042 RepID=A0A7C9IFY6_9RHOB|nr:DNA mismatch repair endonuclease MutL [Kangsaoukella pontilimi]MXQ07607.1 DNA mismatch repair endonuclease MutL [Kangsaoukella pontilimi]